jgi:uncharacterized delta-60 repeat protein
MAGKRGVGTCAESLESRRLLSGGLLDTTYGTNGFAVVTKSGFGFRAMDVAPLANGKLIVAGLGKNSSGNHFAAIARLNADGSMDTTFGPDHSGVVSAVPNATTGGFGNGNISVAVQSDGKIVLAATDLRFLNNTNIYKAMVQRFNANGSFDTTFGSPIGSLGDRLDFGALGQTYVNDVAIQRDGKIVITGSTLVSGLIDPQANSYVARLNANGSLDQSFGDGGSNIVEQDDVSEGDTLAIDYNGSAASNPNYGKIIMAGDAASFGDVNLDKFYIARFNTNGKLDSSFHHNGKLTQSFVSEDTFCIARAIDILPNDQIVIAGSIDKQFDFHDDFGIIRLNKDGSGDKTFGPSNGQLAVDFGGDDVPLSIMTSQTGELIVGGSTGAKSALVMIKTNGLIDTAFGPNGTGKEVVGQSGATTSASAMTRTLNGKFFVAGGDALRVGRYFDRGFSTFSITAIAPNASETGPTPAAFTISRPEILNTPTRVFFQAGGTATSPFALIKKFVDYTGITAPPPPGIGQPLFPPDTAFVDIPAGQRSVTFTITPKDDTFVEANESVIFTLEPDASYDIAPGHRVAQATIRDNDSPATGATLTATADAYVRDGTNAGANFGTAADLEAKTAGSGFNRVSYIKFDLSSVSTINSVKLDLFGKISDTQNASIVTSVFSVANTSWTETGITFSNAPVLGSAQTSTTVSGTTAKLYQFDVTAYVKAQKAAGHNIISFAIKNPSSSSSFVQFNSREAASNKPALVIT